MVYNLMSETSKKGQQKWMDYSNPINTIITFTDISIRVRSI